MQDIPRLDQVTAILRIYLLIRGNSAIAVFTPAAGATGKNQDG
jgi:hypothetical protein